jgi:hypothetical protein
MAMRNIFDRYEAYFTACLAFGPVPRYQLSVPDAALRALQKAGIAKPKTHVSGSIATQWWYLPQHFPVTEPAPDCSAMSFEEPD